MPAKQLRPSETKLLTVETPTALGHTSTLTILDTSSVDHAISGRLLTAEVSARLDELPILRQSLVELPLGFDRPWWRDEAGFDLGYHLRYIAVPEPDDPRSLADLVARIHSRPLDRRRPLWELYLISGLADDRVALLSKVHLAALGSAAGAEITAGLVGPTPDLLSESGDGGGAWRPRPGPSTMQILGRAWHNALVDPVRTAARIPRLLATVPRLGGLFNPGLTLLSQRSQKSIVFTETGRMAPRTSFNRRVGPHRRWIPVELDMDRIAALRRTAGVRTVDIVTAICGGALRWWLLERDELPLDPLLALVPLSVTDPNAIDGLAGVVVSLETNRHEVGERLRAVHEEIGEAVVRHGALPAADIGAITDGSPLTGLIASRLLERSTLFERLQPPFNTVVTSVPGPTGDRYALGAPVVAIHPILGVVDGIGLHIGAMSLPDRLCLSLVADRDLVPDLEALAGRIPEELSLLEASAL